MAKSKTFDRIFGGAVDAPSSRETLCKDKPLVNRTSPPNSTNEALSPFPAGGRRPSGREVLRQDSSRGYSRRASTSPPRSDSMQDIIKMDPTKGGGGVAVEEAPIVRDQPTLNKTSTTYEKDLPQSHKVGAVMGPPGIFSQSPGGNSIYVALSNGSYRIREPLAAPHSMRCEALRKQEYQVTGESSTHADGGDGPSSQCDALKAPLRKQSDELGDSKSMAEGSHLFSEEAKVVATSGRKSSAARSPSPPQMAKDQRASQPIASVSPPPPRRRASWSKMTRGRSAPNLEKVGEAPSVEVATTSDLQTKQKGPPIGLPQRATNYPFVTTSSRLESQDSPRQAESSGIRRDSSVRSPSPKASVIERCSSSPVLAKGSLWSKLDNSLKEEYHVQRSDNDNDVVILTRKSTASARDRLDSSYDLQSNSDLASSNFDPQRREPKPMRFSVGGNCQISGAERRHFSPLPRELKKGMAGIFRIPEGAPSSPTGVVEGPQASELDLNVLLTAESMVQRVPPKRVKQTWQDAEQMEIKQLRTREAVQQRSRDNVKSRWK